MWLKQWLQSYVQSTVLHPLLEIFQERYRKAKEECRQMYGEIDFIYKFIG